MSMIENHCAIAFCNFQLACQLSWKLLVLSTEIASVRYLDPWQFNIPVKQKFMHHQGCCKFQAYAVNASEASPSMRESSSGTVLAWGFYTVPLTSQVSGHFWVKMQWLGDSCTLPGLCCCYQLTQFRAPGLTLHYFALPVIFKHF